MTRRRRTLSKKRQQIILVRLREAIKEERRKRKITQDVLARRMRTSQSWVTRIESGRQPITFDQYNEIAGIVGFDPLEILTAIYET